MIRSSSSFGKPAAVTAFAMSSLVRGQEQALMDRIAPLLRHQNVALDLSAVRRIDAAGIAALLALHASAHGSGHCFTVANPSPRVVEILTLVGLEGILVSHDVNIKSHCGSRDELTAA